MSRIDLQRPDWSLFHGQFFLTRQRVDPGPAWHQFPLGEWLLYVHNALPVCRITDGQGLAVGLFLGHGIALTGELQDGDLQIPTDPDDEQLFTSQLYQIAGRWACLLWTGKYKRFYLDPLGSLAAVYAPSSGTLASTTTLVNVLAGAHARNLARPVYRYTPSGFQYGDLTPFEDIHRLLPNHYLDIARFTSVRHHYQEVRPARVAMQDRTPLAAEVAHHLQAIVATVARRYPVACTLTGGRDTRLLLACCKPFLDETRFFTFRWDRQGRNAPIDQEYPQRLAERFRLHHQYIHAPQIDAYTDQLYQMRIGFSTTSGQAPNFYAGVRAGLEPGVAVLTGFGGYHRDHFWAIFDKLKQPVNGRTMVQTFHGKHLVTPRNVEAMEQLLAEITWDDPHDLIDVLYLEQRVGSWSSPMMYGFAPGYLFLSPFCHRTIQDIRLRYPKRAIRRTTLTVETINYIWPELSELPYNKYRGVRELRRKVARRIRKYRRRWHKN